MQITDFLGRYFITLPCLTLSKIGAAQVFPQLIDLFVLPPQCVLQVCHHPFLLREFLASVLKVVCTLLNVEFQNCLLALQLIYLLPLAVHRRLDFLELLSQVGPFLEEDFVLVTSSRRLWSHHQASTLALGIHL